jgi:hypothetical protein
MRRGAAGAAGFVFGLFWVWCCLYILGHTKWTRSNTSHSCVDAGDCTWSGTVAAALYVLAPSIIFAVLNGSACGRWTARRWARWFLGLTLLTAVFYTSIALLTR